VHGALQTVDLADGSGLAPSVTAQCEAEGIADRSDEVAGLVAAALASPSVREAATRPHWREVYACTPIGDRLLEGYVDLLYRTDRGLVIVDYKTSASTAPHDLDRRVAGYRLQGAAYALALSSATGESVERVTFVFLTPEGAIERQLCDLHHAVRDVDSLVRLGAETTVD
jgi:ATP-dependent helicase/nuclease subunit A